MPIYEFVCRRCQRLTEILVRGSIGKVEIRCPDCGSTELDRVVSRVNSVVADGPASAAPSVEHRSCPTGTCSTITLPGHTRSS